MNGLAAIRAVDWRTSSSTSVKVSAAHGGRIPVSASIRRRNSSSEKVARPQSVWWRSMISSVPSRRWEMESERIASSVIAPPALRITWASPSSSPSARAGSRRASMHATIATRGAGRPASPPMSKPSAYALLRSSRSSVTLMRGSTGSVLGRPLGAHALGDLRRALVDGREAHDGDLVLERHLAAVDLLEEVLSLLDAAKLGVVVLDVARRQLVHALHLDGIDDCLEDLLARCVLKADGNEHSLAAPVLVRLVAEADGGGLAPAPELVDEDR